MNPINEPHAFLDLYCTFHSIEKYAGQIREKGWNMAVWWWLVLHSEGGGPSVSEVMGGLGFIVPCCQDRLSPWACTGVLGCCLVPIPSPSFRWLLWLHGPRSLPQPSLCLGHVPDPAFPIGRSKRVLASCVGRALDHRGSSRLAVRRCGLVGRGSHWGW